MTDELTELRIFLEQKAAAQQCRGWDVDGWPAGQAWGPLRCPRCGQEIPVRAVRHAGPVATPQVEPDGRAASAGA